MYFVVSPDEEAIKIGFAVDPRVRIKGLQTAHYEELFVELILAGRRSDEALVHKRLEQHRITREWFRICPEVEDFIAELADARFILEARHGEDYTATISDCLALESPGAIIDDFIDEHLPT